MKNYELTIVLPGEASVAKKKSTGEKIEKLVKLAEGKIKKTDDWGKIELAYKIGKENSGNFVHYDLEINGSGVKNIKDKLRLEGGIMRYLLIRV